MLLSNDNPLDPIMILACAGSDKLSELYIVNLNWALTGWKKTFSCNQPHNEDVCHRILALAKDLRPSDPQSFVILTLAN